MGWLFQRDTQIEENAYPTGFRSVGAIIARSKTCAMAKGAEGACSNAMSTVRVTVQEMEVARSTQALEPRYESLIRLAEAIRSHRDQKDLFQVLVDELHHVVPFDAMAQFDRAGNRINWRFSEAYDSRRTRVSDIPKEETVAWWVHRTQQPEVLQVANEETSFRTTIEALAQGGLRPLAAFP